MCPRSRALVPVLAIAAAAALVAGPALGQVPGGVKKAGELSTARCYGHHREEGFRSMDFFPTTIATVKQGEAFEFRLTVVVPWLHELLDPVGFVNISGMPGATFPGAKEPFALDEDGALAPASVGPVALPGQGIGASARGHAFPVDANATEIVATLDGSPGPDSRNAWQLTVVSPRNQAFGTTVAGFQPSIQSGSPQRLQVRVPYSNVTDGGEGEWRAIARFARGTEPSGTYHLNVQVHYNLSQSAEYYVKGPAKIGKKGQHTFAFTIVAPPETMDAAQIVYGAKGIAFHKHTDLNAEDYGNYTKFNVMTFRVGGETRIGTSTVAVAGPDPGPLMRAYAQVLGFAGSFLLLPALFLGGTFGRGSVTFFNRMLSARRRVLWHNSTSYLLLTVSVLHMFLFLFEHFWDWSVGIVWGGLSLAAMASLAVTGAFQRRFVAHWGFERWRFVHFSLGVLVVGFVLVHLLADGSHLSIAREWLEGL